MSETLNNRNGEDQKEAKNSSENPGEIAWNEERFFACAHDLRNPLASVRSYAELLIKLNTVNAEGQKLTLRIIKSVDRMDRMLQSLLDFYLFRFDAQSRVNCHDCDLSRLLNELQDDYRALQIGTFDFVIDSCVKGSWNEECLRRAIENLCNNALKYGDISRPITVRLKKERQGAVVTVHNYGEPVAESELLKIFQPFHKAGNERTFPNVSSKFEKSWGLGLYLVKQITEAFRGKVDVKSNPQEGTTFSIFVPYQVKE